MNVIVRSEWGGEARYTADDSGKQDSRCPRWKEILCVALLGVTFTCGWAVLKGEYISWDQRNYYYYNA
ncbi:MAG: hypothetical protein HY651_04275 [Acidobacteria bacterium]|nr:hypothetical protein [Acidobacteriota bacterium]